MGESTGSFPSPVLCAELGRRLPRARVLRNLGSLGLPRAALHSQPLGISPRSVAGIETCGLLRAIPNLKPDLAAVGVKGARASRWPSSC